MTNHKSKAQEIMLANWRARGAFQELAEFKIKEDQHLVDLITSALREAELSGARKMREKLADTVLKIDNTFLGPEYRDKLSNHFRALSPESVVEG